MKTELKDNEVFFQTTYGEGDTFYPNGRPPEGGVVVQNTDITIRVVPLSEAREIHLDLDNRWGASYTPVVFKRMVGPCEVYYATCSSAGKVTVDRTRTHQWEGRK